MTLCAAEEALKARIVYHLVVQRDGSWPHPEYPPDLRVDGKAVDLDALVRLVGDECRGMYNLGSVHQDNGHYDNPYGIIMAGPMT